jgi:hypothetical protein
MTKADVDFPIEGLVGHVEDGFPTSHTNDVDKAVDATVNSFGVGCELLCTFTGGDIAHPSNTGGTNFGGNLCGTIGINIDTHHSLCARLHERVRGHASHANTGTGHNKGATVNAKA